MPPSLRPAGLLALALVLSLVGLLCAQQPFTPALDALLLRGLVSWWRAVPGLTNGDRFLDLMASRNHLTLTNMSFGSPSGWGPSLRRGGTVQLNCDGTNDYATIPKNTTLNLTTGTIAAWAYRAAATGEHVIVSLGDGSSLGDNFVFLEWHTTSDKLRWGISIAGANAVRGDTVADFGIGVWWHVVVTVDSTGNTLYVNGLPQSLTYLTGDSTSSQFLSAVYPVATSWDVCRLDCGTFPNYLPGAVDDIMLFSRALSAAEVAELYRLGQQPQPEGLMQQMPSLATLIQTSGFFHFFP